MVKKKNDDIVISRKTLLGLAPGAAIVAVLLSGNKEPEALLFLIGIVVGILIGRGMFMKD